MVICWVWNFVSFSAHLTVSWPSFQMPISDKLHRTLFGKIAASLFFIPLLSVGPVMFLHLGLTITFIPKWRNITGPTDRITFHIYSPQWGAADAEIKVPSGENTELKRFPFIAWSRSVYSHTCYAYCQGFLPCLFLPFQSIHLHFFQNLSRFFPVLALANTGSCVGQQNKIGQPAWCGFPCWVPAEYK